MLSIIKSVAVICFISTGISMTCFMYLDTSLPGMFILSTIVQLALGWFINTYIDYKNKILVSEQQTVLLSQIESEAVQAPCAYCNAVNLIPIVPDQNNDFECIECGESNSVYVNITIAQKSAPIDQPQFDVTNFNTNLDRARESILNNEQESPSN